jgi:hypothetical protein
MRKQIWASISSSRSFGGNNESASNGNQVLLLCEESEIQLQMPCEWRDLLPLSNLECAREQHAAYVQILRGTSLLCVRSLWQLNIRFFRAKILEVKNSISI